MTSSTTTSDDIRDLARIDEKIARLTPQAVVAIVAPQDHIFGMARMWETIVEGGWSTSVFRTREEADRWIQRMRPSRV